MSSSPEPIEITSIGEMIDALRRPFGEDPPLIRSYWYRGEGRLAADWKLRPKAHRNGRSIEDERKMARAFVAQSPTRHPRVPQQGNWAGWMALMQHYGLPTRLLDWTSSPLFALFFAVGDKKEEGDAVVWVLNADELNSIMGAGRDTLRLDDDPANALVEAVFRWENADPPGVAYGVFTSEIDIRMTVQQSSFTIHSRDVVLDDHPSVCAFLRKLVVPAMARARMQEQLFRLGIDRMSLFPDLGNLAAQLAETNWSPDGTL